MNFKFWSSTFWKDIGYGLGSSPYLARRLINIADLGNAGVILELGAGKGQVTEHILANKSSDTRFLTVENDHQSFLALKEKYGTQCEIHEMSAAHIDTILPNESVDIVISTLPLGSISPEGVDHILRAIHACLKPGGRYIQYQYWMYNRKDIKRYFTIERTFWEPRNIGPAFIYRACKK